MPVFDDIRLLRVTFLRGPNQWTYRSALEVWLDLGVLEDWPSNRLPGFLERLSAALPAVAEHHCGVGEAGGFGQRLSEGTWLGHVMEHVIIELLNLAGMPTGFGQTRSTSQHGVYRMVFRARDEEVARVSLAQGHRLLMNVINGLPVDVPAAVNAVRDAIDSAYLGPSTAHIVASATERNIPHIRLNSGNLVQLGHGRRQHRIWTAETGRTSAIAEGIAGDKDLTKQLLATVGVPVPEGHAADSPAHAWELAQELGLPVVIKPADGNHGRGVALDLRKEKDIHVAWEVANNHGSEVLVERYIMGNEHRLLVVAGKVVAAARGEAAWVTGDGVHDMQALVDQQINTDPRRGDSEDHPLARLYLHEDEVLLADLARQGLRIEDIPEAGRRVLIQRNGNVAIDCTDDVHPEVARIVELAVRTIALDIAGVDLVCEDIRRPLAEQGGAIVEVNAGPGLLVHLKPAEGSPRPVGRAIVEHLFPGDAGGRIPIVGIAGGGQTRQVARLTAWLMQLGGHAVGLACRDGLFLNGRCIEEDDATDSVVAQRILISQDVDCAVFENGPATILDQGLAYDRCHVGVVTDFLGAEALARHDIFEAEQLARVLRTQMDVVLSDGFGVLNADDPAVAALATYCDGSVVLYATSESALAEHRQRGGKAVRHDGQSLWLCEGATERSLVLHNVAEQLPPAVLLPAVAAAWAHGLAPALLAAGIDTFGAHAGAA
jgi:cyanophycin synthetase